MLRFTILSLFLFTLLSGFTLFAGNQDILPKPVVAIQPDTLWDNQTLYNGRIWRNLYYLVQDDPFLFSKEFLPGVLTIRSKTFNNVLLKYDILNDEVLTPIDSGRILELNKELIDSFSLSFQNRKYLFIKMTEDTLKAAESFFNVLYKGKTTLLLKHEKKIDKLAVDGKYDKFYQVNRIFIVSDEKLYQVNGKADLFKVMPEDKGQLKDFMKSNKIRISGKNPESFIPVIRFHDRNK
ncbi:MAG TPA: hypothetical protein VFE71_07330 [Bacteroidales bacterium]|nr:hypothetical protein [Bacteroidales bacterium]